MTHSPKKFCGPGLHESGSGAHSVVWFDPSILPGASQIDGGIEDDTLLKPTASEPAAGLLEYEKWRADRSLRLAEGAEPEIRVRRITEVDTLPDGLAFEVEIVRVEPAPGTQTGIKRGRRYGDLVHALLARADYQPDRAALEAQAAAHEIGAKMSAGDRQFAIDSVLRTLAHPLLSEAFRVQRMHREYPVTFEAGGELYEGVIDLTWFDGSRWTVVDYKTGPGDEPRYRRQVTIYGETIRKTTGMPVRLVVLEIA